MELKKGLVQIYSGNGKGKTTASIGQIIRATGNGFNTSIMFFFKDIHEYPSGEYSILKNLGVKIFFPVPKCPLFNKDIKKDEMREQCLNAINFIQSDLFAKKTIDLLVLDEIFITLFYDYLKEEEILGLIRQKPENVELILTGRGATEIIIRHADLVSNIEKIKHPYDIGITQRRGIEY